MESYIVDIEGLEIEIEKHDDERKNMANVFLAVREKSGMSRKEFSEWLGIPYRTMQEWELGRRMMPDYLLRLIAYKVKTEKLAEKDNM